MSEPVEVHAQKLAEHADFVRRVACALVRDPTDADDVAQETCLAALRSGPGQPEALRAWLRSTARNIACKLHRARARRTARERGAPRPEPAETTALIVERLQTQRVVVDAVLELDEPCRTALLLRYYEDLGPRQIALRQGVPLDTVRSWLRRGLSRLRARLDAEHGGDRSAWCSALFPLTQLGGVPAAAGAPAGMTAGLLGLFTRISTWAAAFVLLGSVLTTYWLILEDEPARSGEQTAPAEARSLAADDPLDAGRPDPVPGLESGALVGEPERLRVPNDQTVHESVPLPRPGRVRFCPYDALIGEPVRNVTVRYSSEDRFADGGKVDVTAEALLTAGDYLASLTAPGFEPRELGPFTVQAEQTLDLGFVPMVRGYGIVSGRVVASAPPATEITVELLGQGRHPCRAAELDLEWARQRNPALPGPVSLWGRSEPCSHCGFQAAASRMLLKPGDGFQFTGLASGPYLLRAFIDGSHPIGTTREFHLAPGGRRFEELALCRTVQLTFELRDPEGNPVTGLHESERGTRVSGVNFLFLEGTHTRAEARAGRSLKLFGDTSIVRVSTGARSVMQVDLLADLGQQRPLDRPRKPDDTLFPNPSPPRHDPPTLAARVEAPGRYVVEGVPAEPLDIVVRSGPLISDRHSLDLSLHDGQVVWMQLYDSGEPPEAEDEITITSDVLLISDVDGGFLRLRSAGTQQSGTVTLSTSGSIEVRSLDVVDASGQRTTASGASPGAGGQVIVTDDQ